MFVFERFNSWLCKRALNMRYPEATAIETFIIHDWCSFMVSSGRMPDLNDSFYLEAFENALGEEESESIVSTEKIEQG